MTKIVTVEQMRAIEQAADAAGLTYDKMMENAGRAVADAILKHWLHMQSKQVLILVGSGNNGGDGLVAGHYLIEAGAQVSAYLTKARTDDDANFVRLRKRAKHIATAEEDKRWRILGDLVRSADLILDGVLGTGFQLPLKGSAKDVLASVTKSLEKRERAPFIVAIDCPSGLDCDSGEIAEQALSCDLTVTLAAAKLGLFRFPGAEKVGKIAVADIGIPSNQKEISSVELELATSETVRAWIPVRPKNAHKGTFGRALIVAGSINYPGAAALAGLGAYRVGAGLVTLAVPSPVQIMLASQLPEATWIVLPHEIGVIAETAADVLHDEVESSQAILLGPGFGQDPSTANFLQRFLGGEGSAARGPIGFVPSDGPPSEGSRLQVPCIVDADGLKLLIQLPAWTELLPASSILTPHPGEMAIMTEIPKDEIQSDRVAITQQWAKTWGHIVVLKGAFTVVAAPDGRSAVLPFATPALARAGTGDVLAGTIAGLRAQGVESYEAAVLGAYLHGRAGELAAEMIGSVAGVIAGDVADALPLALAELDGGLSRI
ncbi:MAG: NAD(P)H-hydrate dehydratase [Anaerolineales bacterium]|nr:NAD(P)H-hydrate dehydratase [Anaerolineales bacterium]